MRIIAGTLKGRRLETPSWAGLRPTSDRLRETLFNVLAPVIPGARVLDAYAGTGAIGIEAISRGAAHVTFVDCDARATALVTRNLQRCGIRDGYAIIRDDAARAVPATASQDFDVIVLDPPYDAADAAPVVAALAPALAPGGVLVLEHARRHVAPPAAGALTLTRALRAGDSALAFYRHVRIEAAHHEP